MHVSIDDQSVTVISMQGTGCADCIGGAQLLPPHLNSSSTHCNQQFTL